MRWWMVSCGISFQTWIRVSVKNWTVYGARWQQWMQWYTSQGIGEFREADEPVSIIKAFVIQDGQHTAATCNRIEDLIPAPTSSHQYSVLGNFQNPTRVFLSKVANLQMLRASTQDRLIPTPLPQRLCKMSRKVCVLCLKEQSIVTVIFPFENDAFLFLYAVKGRSWTQMQITNHRITLPLIELY